MIQDVYYKGEIKLKYMNKYDTRNVVIVAYVKNCNDFSNPYCLFFADSEQEAQSLIYQIKHDKRSINMYYKFCIYHLVNVK